MPLYQTIRYINNIAFPNPTEQGRVIKVACQKPLTIGKTKYTTCTDNIICACVKPCDMCKCLSKIGVTQS